MGSSNSHSAKTTSDAEHLPTKQTNMKNVDFKLHIAVDFGTDGSALAFAYKDKVTIYNKWRVQRLNAASRATTKTKTHLILNEDNTICSFGNAAKFIYFNLTKYGQKKKKFFERFKMALYEMHLDRSNDIIEHDKNKNREDVNIAKYLYASNGEPIESKIVFIAAFQELQKKAKEFIPRGVTKDYIA
eukprot:198304_1